MHVYFINCFNAISGNTCSSNLVPRFSPLHVPGSERRDPGNEVVAVAPTVRFTGSVVMMWPICYSDTFFNFNLGDKADCMSNGRLREVKNY